MVQACQRYPTAWPDLNIGIRAGAGLPCPGDALGLWHSELSRFNDGCPQTLSGVQRLPPASPCLEGGQTPCQLTVGCFTSECFSGAVRRRFVLRVCLFSDTCASRSPAQHQTLVELWTMNV